ncbi:MAG TPA: class I SAM-dependent methyltransferase [bacterium]|nr:class I SAM-dependent methyltransferase [bacterium]
MNDTRQNNAMSERIRRSIEEAQMRGDPEYLSLQPKEDLPEPDPDTDKSCFSETRKVYESRLDRLNDGTLTGQSFAEAADLDEILIELNQTMATLADSRQVSGSGGLFRRFVRKVVLYGLGPVFGRMEKALSDLTRSVNAINHKSRCFAAEQNQFNTTAAEFGQSIVPVIDEKIRYQLKKTSQYLKDRMDIFHEGTDRRQTEIANWLTNATAVFEDCITRVDRMESEMQRGLALQHRKLEQALSAAPEFQRVQDAKQSSRSVPVSPGDFEAAGGEYAYYLFENQGRGPESAIREMQQEYIRYFRELDGPVLDIGCGRGEFLELLRDAGIEASGIDSNGDMVAICRQKDLSVVQGDGVRGLEALPENSLGGVFAAQVVEHLSTAELNRWLVAAHRALKPGGRLLYETINTASMYALVTHFFKDPTHTMPRHPDTYGFLTRIAGFESVSIAMRSPVTTPDLPVIPEIPGEEGDGETEPVLHRFKSVLEKLTEFVYAPCDIMVHAQKQEPQR